MSAKRRVVADTIYCHKQVCDHLLNTNTVSSEKGTPRVQHYTAWYINWSHTSPAIWLTWFFVLLRVWNSSPGLNSTSRCEHITRHFPAHYVLRNVSGDNGSGHKLVRVSHRGFVYFFLNIILQMCGVYIYSFYVHTLNRKRSCLIG